MHAAINGIYDVIINPHVSTRSLIIERISNPSVPLTVCEVEAFTGRTLLCIDLCLGV
ncbi:hypothetical protein DPMN_159600 [Dreissena polymorpha]|uniref:Uncharacterized protein n=1 Tax=Dreissena polymorpha TaxID=45954 RepID=A0A9D4IRV6_DREPO|nr:hypothetical protein DPMN_159600 [Dreissena polymorpha]